MKVDLRMVAGGVELRTIDDGECFVVPSDTGAVYLATDEMENYGDHRRLCVSLSNGVIYRFKSSDSVIHVPAKVVAV